MKIPGTLMMALHIPGEHLRVEPSEEDLGMDAILGEQFQVVVLTMTELEAGVLLGGL